MPCSKCNVSRMLIGDSPSLSHLAPRFVEFILDRSACASSCQVALESDHAELIFERTITAVRKSLSPSFFRAVAQFTSKSVHGACTDAGDDRQKQEGVNAYRKDAFGTAATCFTQGLALIDERQQSCKQEACQALSNRALCHLQLGDAEAALQDCSLALVLTPDNTKAGFRKALALEQLGRHAQALDAASSAHALCSTGHAGAHAAAALVYRLRAAVDAKTAQTAQPAQTDGQQQPLSTGQPAPALPRLELGFSTSEGRALQVQSQVQEGALLLQEDPLAVVCSKQRRKEVRSDTIMCAVMF